MRVSVHQVSGRNADICVRTRCRTIDELVTLFGRYLEGNSLFVATLGTRSEGAEAVFSIALVDGFVALRGRGVVEKAWTNAENPFKLPGILLAVRTLTATSKALFDRIRAERDRNNGNTAPLTRVPVPLADILSGAEFARWKDEETLIGPPLAEQKVSPSKVQLPQITPLAARTKSATIPPIAPLTARTKSATIPPMPRTVTPLRSPASTKPPTIIKGTIIRPPVAVPIISVPPIEPPMSIAKPPIGTPPIATPTIEAPAVYRVLATATPTPDKVREPEKLPEPDDVREPVRERAQLSEHESFAPDDEPRTQLDVRHTFEALDVSDAAEQAPTIPKIGIYESRRRMSWWARVLLVLLPIAGFTGGAVLADQTARSPTARPTAAAERPKQTQIPVHATIEIDGTKYSVDLVLTAQHR